MSDDLVEIAQDRFSSCLLLDCIDWGETHGHEVCEHKKKLSTKFNQCSLLN